MFEEIVDGMLAKAGLNNLFCEIVITPAVKRMVESPVRALGKDEALS